MFIIRGLSAGLAGLTLLLSGCSSAPRNVNANIPLVSTSSIRLLDSRPVSVPQGNLIAGNQIQISGAAYLIGNSYVSASGLNCKSLKAVATNTQNRTLCQRDGQWEMLAPLLNHTNTN